MFDNNDTTDIKDTAAYIVETFNLDNDIDIPSDNWIAIDAPERVKIITDQNRLVLVPTGSRKNMRDKGKKAAVKKWMKRQVNGWKEQGT